MSIHEYFNRKHTEWSITGFLNESKEEPFRVKIGLYLKSLETIYDYEHGKRQEMARFLLDKYRKEPKTDQEIARKWENERTHKQVHIHQPTINGTVTGTIGIVGTGTISGGTFGVETSKKRDQEDYHEELQRKQARIDDKRDPKNCTFDEYVDGECIDHDDVFEESQPINWEFDGPMPTWLSKVIERQKSLTSQTDLSARFKSSLKCLGFKHCIRPSDGSRYV
ncbi:hypothetical protein C1646_485103 [Rhizophagus diaphanus]|nr:hypothetical protein C1646_485103 [Rhizophagus diaphanus] [Rhizophagus sp. MUCL 43196]